MAVDVATGVGVETAVGAPTEAGEAGAAGKGAAALGGSAVGCELQATNSARTKRVVGKTPFNRKLGIDAILSFPQQRV